MHALLEVRNLERNHNNVLLFWMGGAAIGVRVTVVNRPLEL